MREFVHSMVIKAPPAAVLDAFFDFEALASWWQVSRAICIFVASLAFFGHVWQRADRNGRSLWDRLFGLAVIEDMVPSSMPDRLWTPWGT